jgi:hypothetical protein
MTVVDRSEYIWRLEMAQKLQNRSHLFIKFVLTHGIMNDVQRLHFTSRLHVLLLSGLRRHVTLSHDT